MTDYTLDACLQLVGDRHRRRVIQHLRNEPNRTTTVEDLVDRLGQQTPDSKNGPPHDGEELAIQLHHVHLPKLADYGVVDFEHSSGTVRYRPDEKIESLIDSLSGNVSLANS